MSRHDDVAASPSPQILDACCGGRMWWWDKDHPLAVYMDSRVVPLGARERQPGWSCDPDVVGDFRAMTFEDETFQLVVFDPPHVTRDQILGEFTIAYGALPRETEQADLERGFAECWRVLAPGGTLVFKWAGRLERVQPHFPATPIVGTRQLRKASGLGSRWFIFYKPLIAADLEAVA